MKNIDRLHLFIKSKGLSLNAFDKSIGTSNGYIGKQIKNKASVGADILEKISSTYTDINLNWLIAGQGKMLKENNGDTERAPPEIKCGNCAVLEEKIKERDQTIKDLRDSIKTKDEFIELLKQQAGNRDSTKGEKAA